MSRDSAWNTTSKRTLTTFTVIFVNRNVLKVRFGYVVVMKSSFTEMAGITYDNTNSYWPKYYESANINFPPLKKIRVLKTIS